MWNGSLSTRDSHDNGLWDFRMMTPFVVAEDSGATGRVAAEEAVRRVASGQAYVLQPFGFEIMILYGRPMVRADIAPLHNR